MDGPAAPVQLDTSALHSNRILVLDTFFHIVVWYGATLAKWKQAGYHLKPEYDYLKQLFAAPLADAAVVFADRFPYPRVIQCVEKGSQSRFLMAKLNPSETHLYSEHKQQQYNSMHHSRTAAVSGSHAAGYAEPALFTEDVSLSVFLRHLRKLAVSVEEELERT